MLTTSNAWLLPTQTWHAVLSTSLANDSRNIPVIRRMKNTLRSLIDFTPEDADWETRDRWDALHEMMAGHSQRVEDGSFVEISQTFGKLNSEFNPETAVDSDETGTPGCHVCAYSC